MIRPNLTKQGIAWCQLFLAVFLAINVTGGGDDVLPLHQPGGMLGSRGYQQWHYAAAAPSLYREYDAAPRLHIAVMSLPLWDNFQALHATAEELSHRGHHVTYFVENSTWCRHVLATAKREQGSGEVDCVVVGASTGPTRPLFAPSRFAKASKHSGFFWSRLDLQAEPVAHHTETLSEYLDVATAAHNTKPFTTFLCDLSMFACASSAQFLGVAAVHVSPYTPQTSPGFHTALPATSSAFPRTMSMWQRTQNYVSKLATYSLSGLRVAKLNRVRRGFGVPLYKDAFDVAGFYDTVLVPGLWGLDVPQPLCPNIHPVGPLLTKATRAASFRDWKDDDLAAFLDRCEQGALYVEAGPLGFLSGGAASTLQKALRDLPFCVVWEAAETTPVQPDKQFFVRPPSSVPAGVMRHPNVFVLISPCGHTSVAEAIDASLPILGLPMFEDQGDVCQRLHEAGAGVCLHRKDSPTPRELTQAVWDVVRRTSDYAANLRRLQIIAKYLGGAARAADVIEARQYNLFLQRGSSTEMCTALSGGIWGATALGWRVTLLLFLTLLWCLFLSSAGRAWRYLVPVSHRRVWLARSGAKDETSQLRIVPRRYWHDKTKTD